MKTRKFETIKGLQTNFEIVTKYGRSLPKPKKRRVVCAVRVSPSEFEERLWMAKKWFIYGHRKMSVSEIKKRFNLPKDQASDMLNALKLMQAEYIAGRTVSVDITQPVKAPVRIVPTLSDRLATIRAKYGDEIRIRGEQVKFLEGFVYLLVNPSFPGWIKVGMTIDYEKRLRAYNIPNDPHQAFTFITVKWTHDRRSHEKELLGRFAGVADRSNGEWFKIEVDKALSLF